MIEQSPHTVETVTGRFVDIANPQPKDFHKADIAWSLSREPRFGGHTATELPFSVGQHSIQVADLLRDATDPTTRIYHQVRRYFREQSDTDIIAWLDMLSDPKNHAIRVKVIKYGLLHDGSEAYLRDIPSPVKNMPGLKEAYGKIEAAVMAAILHEDGLNVVFESSVDWEYTKQVGHWADIYARTVEAYHFVPSRGRHWKTNQKITLAEIQQFKMPKPSLVVFEEFLAYLDALDEGVIPAATP